MDLQIKINIPEAGFKLDHINKILTIGSCFADNIADKLKYYRFNIIKNPFGILYNPVSIKQSFELLEQGKQFQEDDLFNFNDEWHSFYHHSDFSHHDLNICLDKINMRLQSAKSFLEKADYLFITYGSAFVYRHIEKDIVVSNCHKVRENQFKRYCLSYNDTVNVMQSTVDTLKKLNPELKIIFTASPVRYHAGEAVENQLSKSTLLLSINEMCDKNGTYYFPSYEIMMDELRDYRFYKKDMVHPSDLAIDYIWEKFRDSIFSNDCHTAINDIQKLVESGLHKPRNSQSKQHRAFISKQIEYIEELENRYPYLNLEKERRLFLKHLYK